MERVIPAAHAAGLVGLHCLEGYGDFRRQDFELILELDKRDDIDLTLYCRDSNPALAKDLAVPRFGGCWCLDGAIGAHSAALAEPYFDKPESRGELYFSDAEITAWLESGLREGMQVCVHAIGERALAQAVDSLESLAPGYDLRAMRPRVDHFVMGTPELAHRAASCGAISAMQPAFDATWGGPDGGYATRLGPDRALRSNPVGQMISAGLCVAGSSDSYITPLDPLGGIRAAMNHHNSAQRVDFETAVGLFSEQGARMAHQEDTRGRIAPGFQADFTVVSGDRSLDGAEVEMTVKSGRPVFSRASG
jgi:predicted amidohydrolase YtcJ